MGTLELQPGGPLACWVGGSGEAHSDSRRFVAAAVPADGVEKDSHRLGFAGPIWTSAAAVHWHPQSHRDCPSTGSLCAP